MKLRNIAGVVALACALVTGGTVTGATAAHAATAATVPAPTAQMVKTCEAYRTWYYSRTPAHLDAVIASTFAGTWTATANGEKYLLEDATDIYRDAADGAAVTRVNTDIKYFGTDCNRYILGL